MLRKWTYAGAIAASALIGGGACGSDDGGNGGSGGGTSSCAQDPASCGTGKTCWMINQQGSYGCIAAGTKQKGEQCSPFLGQTECGEALFCLQTSAATPGQCLSFCDAQNTCASGELCAQVQVNNVGPIVRICVPTGLPDGGAGGTSGAGGTGATGGSAGAAGAAGASGAAGSGGTAGATADGG